MEYGERATVFVCVSFVIASAGVAMRSPENSSLKMERSVGRVGESFPPVVVRRMDIRATLPLLTNMRRRVLPYFRRRRLRARRMRSRVAFQRPLKQVWRAYAGGVPLCIKFLPVDETKGFEIPKRWMGKVPCVALVVY
jgi:hypothetical protein